MINQGKVGRADRLRRDVGRVNPLSHLRVFNASTCRIFWIRTGSQKDRYLSNGGTKEGFNS